MNHRGNTFPIVFCALKFFENCFQFEFSRLKVMKETSCQVCMMISIWFFFFFWNALILFKNVQSKKPVFCISMLWENHLSISSVWGVTIRKSWYLSAKPFSFVRKNWDHLILVNKLASSCMHHEIESCKIWWIFFVLF